MATPTEAPKWIVFADCWLRGELLLWGTIVSLPDEDALSLRQAKRIVLCDEIAHRAFCAHVRGLLTPREREIVQLAATISGDKGIAKKLRISVHTVRIYWQRIFTKLHRHDRTAAALMWMAYNPPSPISTT